jgi:hypothetical protein
MGEVMQTPILPNRDIDDDAVNRRRYLRLGDSLRIVAAALAVVGSVIGLVAHFQGSESRPSTPLPAPTDLGVSSLSGPYVYGDPSAAALRSVAKAHGGERSVCTDEARPLPTTGAWACHDTQTIGASEFGRPARDTGGPCTHRVASQVGAAWNCWTRIPIPKIALGMPYAVPLMFGQLVPAGAGEDTRYPRVCRTESRASETHGGWTCVAWQEPPEGWRIVEPVDPGGQCSYRVADEVTGVWSCQSGTAQDARQTSWMSAPLRG